MYPTTSSIRLYDLYNQKSHGTVWTIQSSNFVCFGEMNRLWYLGHTTSVWSHLSCVRFVSARPTHKSILKPLWDIWFLGLPGPILVPRSNPGSLLYQTKNEIFFFWNCFIEKNWNKYFSIFKASKRGKKKTKRSLKEIFIPLRITGNQSINQERRSTIQQLA